MLRPGDLDSFHHFEAHPDEIPEVEDPRAYPPGTYETNWMQRHLSRVVILFLVIVVATLLTMATRGVGLGSNTEFMVAVGWALLISIVGLVICVALLAVIHFRIPVRV